MRFRLSSVALTILCACSHQGFDAAATKANATTISPGTHSIPTPTPAPEPSPAPTPAPAPVARSSAAANLRSCPGTSLVLGIDVSNYDLNTNWPTVSADGNGFVLIKATEGITDTNSLFASSWAGAKAVGLIRAAYHFYHPKSDPTQQAQHFLATLGTLAANDLPPVFDWEVTDGEAASLQIQNAKTWLTLVEAATGKTPMIYTDPGFWNTLGNPQGFERYPLFIAETGVTCPQVPPPWSTWTFWQKSQTGTVSGVDATLVDIDEFNGTADELEGVAEPH